MRIHPAGCWGGCKDAVLCWGGCKDAVPYWVLGWLLAVAPPGADNSRALQWAEGRQEKNSREM